MLLEAPNKCWTCSRTLSDDAVRACARKPCDAGKVLAKCDALAMRKRQDEERKAAPTYASPNYVDPYKSIGYPLDGL